MKTVFPKEPAKDFNEWINYIKQQIDKSLKVNENPFSPENDPVGIEDEWLTRGY